MTVYINGKFLCQQKTGTQIYAWSMLSAMRLKNVDFVILSPKSADIPKMYSGLKIGFFSRPSFWEQFSLPLFLLGKKDALLINFCNSAPLFVSNQIVTIHDLAFEQNGVNWFKFGFKTWYRFLIPRICQRAKLIFTVSGFSKTEISNTYQVSKSKIHLVPNVLPAIEKIDEKPINENYILLVGAENPRKNAQFVLSQLDFIQANGCKLVMVSAHSTHFPLTASFSHPALIHLNYLSTAQYYSYLKHAQALIYLSSYEGFGIPILESLSLNTPVICLELPVFKENFKDLPIYMTELSRSAFEEALRNIKGKRMNGNELRDLFSQHTIENSGMAILNALSLVK